MICEKCGKTIETTGAAFCPFCGAAMPARAAAPVNAEAEKWLKEAAKTVSYPDREKVLLKARKACPDCFEIEFELLFIGKRRKSGPGRVDFFLIRSYLLEMYLKPEEFSERERAEMRKELFENEQLLRCRELSEDPEAMTDAYLLRLSREFIDLFMAGDSRIVRTLFGFRLDRNVEKVLAQYGAGVLTRIRQDRDLPQDRRDRLYQAFYRALSERMEGRTEYLDEALAEI